MAKKAQKTAPAPAPVDEPEPLAIQTVEQLDAALRELSELASIEGQLKEACEKRIAQIKDDFQKRMICTIEESSGFKIAIPIPERRKTLTEEITQFCQARQAELLKDQKGKTRKLTHGSVSWKQVPKSIEPLDGEQTVWGLHVATMVTACLKVLAKLKLIGEHFAKALIRIDINIDKPAVLKLLSNSEISEAELQQLGFKVCGGNEKFDFKTTKTVVENHAEA